MNSSGHATPYCNYASITVVGGGKSGRALALLGKQLGMSVFLSDTSAVPPETRSFLQYSGIPWEEEHSKKILDQDAIILSSGIPPSSPVVSMAQEAKVPLLGELDFVTPHIKGDLIGVTGSNGKSTTVALLAHILQESFGEKITAGGNIGIPLGELALKNYSCIVAELSSFQLYWAHASCLVGGGITNIVPDHLDWHGGYDSYVKAKKNILSLLNPDFSPFFVFRNKDTSYFLKEDFHSSLGVFPFYWENEGEDAQKLWNKGIFANSEKVVLRNEGEEVFLFNPSKDLPLLGRHNVENAAFAASLAFLWRRSEDSSLKLLKGVRTFVSLPHRCENLGTKQGVTFVNDSKGTNVAATVTALESLEGNILILLGGKGKGEDYQELAKAVSLNARGAVLFGAEAPSLEKALQGKCPNLSVVPDLEKAFLRALDLSQENDTILLSPACTSWDAYKSYTERGDHFRNLVRRTFFDSERKKLTVLP